MTTRLDHVVDQALNRIGIVAEATPEQVARVAEMLETHVEGGLDPATAKRVAEWVAPQLMFLASAFDALRQPE